MKNIIILSCLVLALGTISCRKKTRTCSCKITTTATTVTTQKNGGGSQQSTTVTVEEKASTYDKVKKSELRRFMNCNSRVESGFNSHPSGTADVNITTITNYDCEIK